MTYYMVWVDATSYEVDASQTSLAVAGLDHGTTYAVLISAHNEDADGAISDIASFTTKAVGPTAPNNITYDNLTASSFTVIWEAPTNYGGNKPLTHYIVLVDSSDYISSYQVDSDTTSLGVTGLNYGTLYTVSIYAQNEDADGTYSDPLTIITKGIPPSAPNHVTCDNLTTESFTVHWLVPDDTGGKALTHYIVQVDSTLYQIDASQLSFNVTGLNYATTYMVSVYAQNEERFLVVLATTPFICFANLFLSGLEMEANFYSVSLCLMPKSPFLRRPSKLNTDFHTSSLILLFLMASLILDGKESSPALLVALRTLVSSSRRTVSSITKK